ncbi:ABC transporter permease [Brachybacterium sacelli]|uniref:ABC-type transport system involved in multi-copper enzyme maturation permease subunit n=1 Tax=Brachybacterium sacelli TaxID=173364 RepID=A0ABS4X486_9MICO|nr:ABC transporter permease [Brachybacterium sacelli]MBP2383048.1 ABC-type transport system involved in multi-copper enzyme maturation permease subunit [Brachybacterium sacelli]
MRPALDIRAHLDTRGTAILLSISLILIVAFAALGGLLQPAVVPGGSSDVNFTVIALSLPLTLIIPIIAVMITAGEWSDGSIQNTFLQRPGRAGVLGSKVLAAIAVIAALVVMSLALAALTTWIGGELLGEGAVFDTFDTVLTTQLATLAATLLFSLAMGVALQSTVLGLLAAIGFPFVIGTASGVATITGSETVVDVVRALDLQTAAVTFADGDAGAFELLPLLLLVILPAAYGAWRWNHREVG